MSTLYSRFLQLCCFVVSVLNIEYHQCTRAFHPTSRTPREDPTPSIISPSTNIKRRRAKFLAIFLSNDNDEEIRSNHEDEDERKARGGGFISKGVPSYSDNWLLRQHNQAQEEYQLKTNALTEYNAQLQNEQQDIREWQEAFKRNGLADFTPPMSFGLNCLMVGTDFDIPNDSDLNDSAFGSGSSRQQLQTKLPWEEEPEADITSLQSSITDFVVDNEDRSDVHSEIEDQGAEATKMLTGGGTSGSAHIAGIARSSAQSPADLVARQQPSTSSIDPPATGLSKAPKNRAAAYDCIVDQGLLGSVLMMPTSNDDNKDRMVIVVQDLLNEASMIIREHGIYVVTTYGSNQLTSEAKDLLTTLGKQAGLEWQFELDGISNAEQQISVARRYNTGVMPKVGRLANTDGSKKSFFS